MAALPPRARYRAPGEVSQAQAESLRGGFIPPIECTGLDTLILTRRFRAHASGAGSPLPWAWMRH